MGTNATQWKMIEKVLGSKVTRTAFLNGPPGIGKTFIAMHYGLSGRKVYCITLTPETPASELRGFWMPHGGEFEWQDGVFVKAMREGARIVVNEIAHASHDVMAIMYPVLESEKTASLTLPTSETVRPAKGFQVICTDNEPLEYLPDAIVDRFDSILDVKEPHPDAIKSIKPEYRDAAMRTFNLDEERRVSIRGWLKIQEYAEEFGERDAFIAVLGEDRGLRLWSATAIGRA